MADFFRPRDFVHRPRKGKREQLSVGAAPVPLSSSVYGIPAHDAPSTGSFPSQLGVGAKLPDTAVIQVLANPIIFTTEGTTPAAAVGFQAAIGDRIYLNTIQEIANFQAIQQGASAGTIEVQYFYGF